MGAVVLQLPDWREEARYGVYTVRACGACGGVGAMILGSAFDLVEEGLAGRRLGCEGCDARGYLLVLVATADTMAAVGVALCTQGEDAHAAGVEPEAYGVLDGHAGRWLAHPPWRNGR